MLNYKAQGLKFLVYLVYLTCLAVVIWQGIQCFDRYFSKPQGTQLSVVSAKNQLFPSFTICKKEKKPFNTSLLQYCGIENDHKYRFYKYANPQHPDKVCQDPSLLWNAVRVVTKPEDLIETVKLRFFDSTGRDEVTIWSNEAKTKNLWLENDHRYYGR